MKQYEQLHKLIEKIEEELIAVAVEVPSVRLTLDELGAFDELNAFDETDDQLRALAADWHNRDTDGQRWTARYDPCPCQPDDGPPHFEFFRIATPGYVSVKMSVAPGATRPNYAYGEASGADLACKLDKQLIVDGGAVVRVNTGIYVEIPRGYEGQIRPRSSALMNGWHVQFGTIDSDYRGELSMLVQNVGFRQNTLQPGTKLAQLVISPVARAHFVEGVPFSWSARGGQGFGSSDRIPGPAPAEPERVQNLMAQQASRLPPAPAPYDTLRFDRIQASAPAEAKKIAPAPSVGAPAPVLKLVNLTRHTVEFAGGVTLPTGEPLLGQPLSMAPQNVTSGGSGYGSSGVVSSITYKLGTKTRFPPVKTGTFYVGNFQDVIEAQRQGRYDVGTWLNGVLLRWEGPVPAPPPPIPRSCPSCNTALLICTCPGQRINMECPVGNEVGNHNRGAAYCTFCGG